MIVKNKVLVLILISLALIIPVKAATVSITQSGADSGTVMKGMPFTITVSGLSDSGTVNLIDLPTGFSTEEGTSKSFSDGTTSVSWTTARISTIQTNVKIKVSISTTGSPSTAESSSFDVVLPPSISLSVFPSFVTVDKDSTYTVTLNVENSGGTSAESVSFSVSGTGMNISSGCSPVTSISPGGRASLTCTVLASAVGTQNVTFTASPSNCDSKSDLITVVVKSTGGSKQEEQQQGGDGGSGGGTGGGIGGGVYIPPVKKAKNATKKLSLVPGVGLRNNTKLQTALEKVLRKGKMSQRAIENLLRLSASITSNLEATRKFKIEQNKSKLELKVKYKGKKKAKNFIIYDSVPKTFANSSDLITVIAPKATVEIIEKDPEYAFVYPEVSEGDELTITYEINGEKDASIVNETSVEFYVEYLEEVQEEQPAKHPKENITQPTEEKQPQEGQPISKPKQPDYLAILIVIIAVGILASAIYYFRFYKRKS